jgi:hypothetical protein
MSNIKTKINNFISVSFAIEKLFPKHYVDTNYLGNGHFESLSLTDWGTEDNDEPVSEFNFKFTELLAVLRKNLLPELTLEAVEDYFFIYTLLSNQMDVVIPAYDHSGWDLSELKGVKQKTSTEYVSWDEVAEALSDVEFTFEDFLFLE